MKQSLEENVDFYYNEDGLMVLTEKFHRQRGYCCGNGCRHCPFYYERIAEPRRSQLIAFKNEREKGKVGEEG